jgi:hypothetical protein
MNVPAGRAFVFFLSVLVASLAFDDARARVADRSQPVESVWRPQKLAFQFRADAIMFSCSALRKKVERILLKVGARAETLVNKFDCSELSHIVRVELLLQSPVEATEANVRRITDFTSHEQLIARVRGDKLPTAEDLERFPAVWTEVSLGRGSKVGLNRSDCALMEQLRTYVLPRLSVQIVKDDPYCSSAFVRGATPEMRVMALVQGSAPDEVLSLRADPTARPAEYR